MKGQVLDDLFSFKESRKDRNEYSGNLRKRVYQVFVNFHIHLGDQMKKIDQGLSVHAGSLPE